MSIDNWCNKYESCLDCPIFICDMEAEYCDGKSAEKMRQAMDAEVVAESSESEASA